MFTAEQNFTYNLAEQAAIIILPSLMARGINVLPPGRILDALRMWSLTLKTRRAASSPIAGPDWDRIASLSTKRNGCAHCQRHPGATTDL